MKRRLLVRILIPLLCGHIKKKKKKNPDNMEHKRREETNSLTVFIMMFLLVSTKLKLTWIGYLRDNWYNLKPYDVTLNHNVEDAIAKF
jgi:hypothetical protein